MNIEVDSLCYSTECLLVVARELLVSAALYTASLFTLHVRTSVRGGGGGLLPLFFFFLFFHQPAMKELLFPGSLPCCDVMLSSSTQHHEYCSS